MNPKVIILFALPLLFPVRSLTQNIHRNLVWFTLNQTYRLKNNLNLINDFSIKSTDALVHIQSYFLKVGLSYKTNKGLNIATGIQVQPARTTMSNITKMETEKQVWQQVSMRKNRGKFSILSRIIVEERLMPITEVQNGDLRVAENDFTARFRLMFKGFWQLGSPQSALQNYYIYNQDEVFVNVLHKEVVNQHVYDQSRSVFGLGRHFKNLDAELGFMYRDLQTKTSLHYHDRILQMTTILKF
jgi:hypothetical protein